MNTRALSPSTYAAAERVRRPLFWILALVALSVPWVVFADGNSADSTEDRIVFVMMALIVVIAQLVFAGLLLTGVRIEASWPRTVVSWYYALAAGFTGFGVVVSLTRLEVHAVMTFLAAGGIVCFAATAVFVLRRWRRLGAARSDAATFLGAGHMLALLGAVASAVAIAADDLDIIGQQVLIVAVLGVTVLGLPASAGLWLRLALRTPSLGARFESRIPGSTGRSARLLRPVTGLSMVGFLSVALRGDGTS